MDNKDNVNKVGTIGEEPVIKDIPTAFFKPIEEIKNQQSEMLENYNREKGNIVDSTIPDLTEEVKKLEKKLKAKRFSVSLFTVLILLLIVNLCWFFGVKFLIVPKYEEYTKVHDEMKKDYDYLKKSVDALVGRE